MTEPLIFTIKGNVPVASLQYHHEWTDTPDYVKFREWYTDAAGEVVKESAHVLSKRGVTGEAIAAQL